MEKLIKLFDEYTKKKTEDLERGAKYLKEKYLLIISKEYGFIQRLVENDKIDRHSKNLELDMKRMRIPQDYYMSGVQSLDLQHKKAQYLSLIALLSIQDNSIEFLCGILEDDDEGFCRDEHSYDEIRGE